MSANIALLVLMGAMYATGIYLLLERSLTKVLLALILMTNATNILIILMGGENGLAPIVKPGTPAEAYNDPLPQAFVLTSIVVSFAITAFLLALTYRFWVIRKGDELDRDAEDVVVASKEAYDAEEDADIVQEESEISKEHEG